MKKVVLYILCVPANLVGWLLLFLVAALRLGRHRDHKPGVLVVQGVPGGFLERRWRYSTTLGPHALYLHPRATETLVQHELVHCSQAEGVSVAWGLAALVSWSWHMLLAWPLCWLVTYAGASFAAWALGRHPYLGNMFEQQAYAVQHELETKPPPSQELLS